MSHTKGEWVCRLFYGSPEEIAEGRELGFEPIPALGNDGERFIVTGETRVCVVDAQTKFKRGTGHKGKCSERDANARLISAAPDLLECARQYMEQRVVAGGMAVDDEQLEAMFADAISKATGEHQ